MSQSVMCYIGLTTILCYQVLHAIFYARSAKAMLYNGERGGIWGGRGRGSKR